MTGREHSTGLQGVCVYCAQRQADTRDHCFPSAWWPEGSTPYPQGWIVPACRQCNQHLGRIEDGLRPRLALGLDPGAPAAKGIVGSVHRGMRSEYGRDPRDARARKARRRAILQGTLPAGDTPLSSRLPVLSDEPVGPDAVAVLIPAADLEAFVEKLARGLTFIHTGEVLGPGYRVRQWQYPDDYDPAHFTDTLNRWGTIEDHSPAIKVRTCRPQDDLKAAVLELIIWDRLRIYVTVQPDDRAPAGGAG